MNHPDRDPRIDVFWKTCRDALREAMALPPDPPPAWSIGDSPAMADGLAQLVLEGTKTATASLLWEYEDEKEPLPRVAELGIVLSGSGQPLLLIETVEVRILPFQDVDAAFAYDEGERDRTLSSWRDGHWRFFSRICGNLGREPSLTMPIVCRRFRVLFRGQ